MGQRDRIFSPQQILFTNEEIGAGEAGEEVGKDGNTRSYLL
jgi:hypothetical protein